MELNDLSISDDCLDDLKSSGIMTVEEIIDFFDVLQKVSRFGGIMINSRIPIECITEAEKALTRLGLIEGNSSDFG